MLGCEVTEENGFYVQERHLPLWFSCPVDMFASSKETLEEKYMYITQSAVRGDRKPEKCTNQEKKKKPEK